MTDTKTRPEDLLPVHDAIDSAKLHELIASMEEHGWTGAPIVVAGDQALTGSHRLAAAEFVGIEVPTVEIADLMAEHGHSWQDLLDEVSDWSTEAWYDAAVRLHNHLPKDVMDHFGLDIH